MRSQGSERSLAGDQCVTNDARRRSLEVVSVDFDGTVGEAEKHQINGLGDLHAVGGVGFIEEPVTYEGVDP